MRASLVASITFAGCCVALQQGFIVVRSSRPAGASWRDTSRRCVRGRGIADEKENSQARSERKEGRLLESASTTGQSGSQLLRRALAGLGALLVSAGSQTRALASDIAGQPPATTVNTVQTRANEFKLGVGTPAQSQNLGKETLSKEAIAYISDLNARKDQEAEAMDYQIARTIVEQKVSDMDLTPPPYGRKIKTQVARPKKKTKGLVRKSKTQNHPTNKKSGNLGAKLVFGAAVSVCFSQKIDGEDGEGNEKDHTTMRRRRGAPRSYLDSLSVVSSRGPGTVPSYLDTLSDCAAFESINDEIAVAVDDDSRLSLNYLATL